METHAIPSSHGGLLFPLDAFRPRLLAAAIAEGLVAKARNILAAKLVLTRHPEVGLVLAQVEGLSGESGGGFWHEHADLCLYASQALPRQCFLYFVIAPPDRREGFMVAQRGQLLAADEATTDTMPPDAAADEWPVARLAAQIRVSVDELAGGFAGGPRIELSLASPTGDDEQLLRTLAGRPPDAGRPGDAPAEPAKGDPARQAAEQDQRRRETEQRAEREERQALATRVHRDLPYVTDELGIVVAPAAELADTDILSPYLVRAIGAELPPGLPAGLLAEIAGKRVDFAVRVEFLSEVFTEAGPLTKAEFEARADTRLLAGREVRVMGVHAPRVGAGTLIARGARRIFVSRRTGEPLPEAFLAQQLEET